MTKNQEMTGNRLAKTAAIGVAALILATTASVYAAAKDRFPIDLEALEAKAAERFNAMDANGDGEIDAGEFEQAKPARHHKKGHAFHQSGRKGHRFAQSLARGEQRDALKAAAKAELFALLDTDEDGQLSTTEHAAQTREISQLARKRAMFKHLDGNGDGVLLPDEIPGRGDRIRAADADGDGQVTRSEMRALRHGRAG